MPKNKQQEYSQKIQELQILEQNMQNLLMQKQAFQIELNETHHALQEIENSKEDVFKVIGQLMIKTEKKKMQQELQDKQKIIDLRLNSLEKQEKTIAEKTEALRQEIIKIMPKKEN